jgi:ATP-dependent RNA circularization protein (DNA/RNA ligase family)
MPGRTTFADLGYRPKRIRLLLTEREWAILEDETDRRAMPLGSTISTILGLAIANRDQADTICAQLRAESAARQERKAS